MVTNDYGLWFRVLAFLFDYGRWILAVGVAAWLALLGSFL